MKTMKRVKLNTDRHAVALACKLSVLTLALAAMAPLPAAASPFSGAPAAFAQATNPCAPKPRVQPAKAAPANPCAPRKAAPMNPCAPKAAAAGEATKTQKADKHCKTTGAANPCAPARKCADDGKH